jgi:hypothetical protein
LGTSGERAWNLISLVPKTLRISPLFERDLAKMA